MPPAPRTSTPHPRATARALVAVAVAVAVAAGALVGCGSSSSPGSTADPASVVPASAPLYVGAVLRPSGTLETEATAAGITLTHQPHAYARLVQALQIPGSPPLDYSSDIAPWLGANGGVFLSSLSTSAASTAQLQQLLTQVLQSGSSATSAWPFTAPGIQGAIVLDTSDVSKAGSFVDTEAKHAGAHAASYRGVNYQATSAGEAFGIVDRLAVLGTVTGLHNVVDTSLGGPELVHAADYSKLLSSAPSGVLAHVYSNPASSASGSAAAESKSASGSSASSGAGSSGSASGLGGLLGLLGGTHQLNVSLVPTSSSIALDVDSLASGTATANGGFLASASEGAQALSELPGESWLGLGLGHVGVTLAGDVQALHALASLITSLGSTSATGPSSEESSIGGFNIKGLLEGVLTPLSALSSPGAQTQQSFLSWMTSAGLFASGSTIVNLRAGVAIGSNNPALSQAAVAKLGAQLSKGGSSVQSTSIPGTDAAISARVNGLPVELDIANGRSANGQTKFVIGLGEASVQDALNPPSTLSSSASSSVAASSIGEGIRPSVVVEFPPLLSLLEGVGLSEDPSISKVVPYLRSLTTLAGGAKSIGGGIERFHIIVGLQKAA